MDFFHDWIWKLMEEWEIYLLTPKVSNSVEVVWLKKQSSLMFFPFKAPVWRLIIETILFFSFFSKKSKLFNQNTLRPMKLPDLLQNTLDELIRGSVDRKHPFRFVTLSTIGKHNFPESRLVVFRKFDKENKKIRIYTDSRSEKMADLELNQQKCALLFWNQKKRWQIRIHAKAAFVKGEEAEQAYQSLPEAGQDAYNSQLPPSTKVDSFAKSNQFKESYDSKNFVILELEIIDLEILQLKDKEHIRAFYTFENGELKESSWLVA
ncbi:MAG: pyridoxine/pyridoxamine 5'-phosphate oxidase [Flammeovirgaceae bacterium]